MAPTQKQTGLEDLTEDQRIDLLFEDPDAEPVPSSQTYAADHDILDHDPLDFWSKSKPDIHTEETFELRKRPEDPSGTRLPPNGNPFGPAAMLQRRMKQGTNIFIPKRQPTRIQRSRLGVPIEQEKPGLEDMAEMQLAIVTKPKAQTIILHEVLEEPETEGLRKERQKLTIDGTQKLKDELPWEPKKRWMYEPVQLNHDMEFGDRSEKLRRRWVREHFSDRVNDSKNRDLFGEDFSIPKPTRKQPKRDKDTAPFQDKDGVDNKMVQSDSTKRKRQSISGELSEPSRANPAPIVMNMSGLPDLGPRRPRASELQPQGLVIRTKPMDMGQELKIGASQDGPTGTTGHGENAAGDDQTVRPSKKVRFAVAAGNSMSSEDADMNETAESIWDLEG